MMTNRCNYERCLDWSWSYHIKGCHYWTWKYCCRWIFRNKNVENYSIVAGVPAKHIRYRFSQDQIETKTLSSLSLEESCIYIFIFLVLGPVLDTPLGILFDPIIIISLFMILYFKINDKKYFINNNLELIHKVIYLPLIYVLLISFPISTIYNDLSFESFFSISRCLKIIITFYGSIAIVTLYKEKF